MFSNNNTSILHYTIIVLITGLFVFAVMYFSIYSVHTVEMFSAGSEIGDLFTPASAQGDVTPESVAMDIVTYSGGVGFVAMTVVKGITQIVDYFARKREEKKQRDRIAAENERIRQMRLKEESDAGVVYPKKTRDGSPIDVLKHSKYRK